MNTLTLWLALSILVLVGGTLFAFLMYHWRATVECVKGVLTVAALTLSVLALVFTVVWSVKRVAQELTGAPASPRAGQLLPAEAAPDATRPNPPPPPPSPPVGEGRR